MTKYIYSEKISLEKRRSARADVFYLVDSEVVDKHESVAALPKRFIVDTKRRSNTVETYNEVIITMLKRKLGKKTLLVAIGGGMVHDLGGFVASTYLRGIRWIYVPTTLVGMADSAIGGRCGLYFDGKDCAIGSDYPPKVVIIHYPFLKTLPQSEWLGGMCELLRTAVLSKKTLSYFEENLDAIKARREQFVMQCLELCKKIKKSKLKKCALIKNRREGLKIGRTIGVALEAEDGKKRTRGEYLIFGLLLEMSMFKADVSPDYLNRVLAIMDKLELAPLDFNVEKLVDKCFEHSSSGIIKIPVPWYYGVIAKKKMDQIALIDFLSAYRTR